MVMVCVHQGLRRDGLTTLAWGNIEMLAAGWRMTVHEKRSGKRRDRAGSGKKPRTIPVLDVVQPILARRWQEQGQPSTGSVWGLDLDTEAAIERSTRQVATLASRLFAQLETDTGRKHTLHDLRATCFSEMQLRGIPDGIIKAFVGHAQATGVSARYAHADCERLRPHVHAIDLTVSPKG